MPLKDKTARASYNISYRKNRGQELLNTKKAYWKERRLTVLTHYSGGVLKCACCAESIYEFLCLDHIDGGGNTHRKALGSRYIYSWIITQGFPLGYQVLCHNCNQAKGFYGLCPHTIQTQAQVQADVDAGGFDGHPDDAPSYDMTQDDQHPELSDPDRNIVKVS